MSGNVWEWCSDIYGPYTKDKSTNPKGMKKGDLRVFKGGGFKNKEQGCRVAERADCPPTYAGVDIGFRMVKSIIKMKKLKWFPLCLFIAFSMLSFSSKAQELFPEGKFTPNGYISNPYHTAVHNKSGILRSVPPIGFGLWSRSQPWPYGGTEFGFGLTRDKNYLSLLQFSLSINDKVLHTVEDYDKYNVELY